MDGARNMNKYDTMLAVNKKRNKRKIDTAKKEIYKMLENEMAALQEENNRLKKALGKRALNTIKNL